MQFDTDICMYAKAAELEWELAATKNAWHAYEKQEKYTKKFT